MRGLLGSIVLATFLASCSGSCQQGLNGKQDWYECEGLNDLNLQIPATASGISITNSNISKIKTDAFSNFSNSLVELNITGCGVEKIEPDAFRGLDKLQVLGLVKNKIRNVNVSWTRGLSKLKKLDLSGNGNVSIDCQAKDVMPKIAGHVRISWNRCLLQTILKKYKPFYFLITKILWSFWCNTSMPRNATLCYPHSIKYSGVKLNDQVRPLEANVSKLEGDVTIPKISKKRFKIYRSFEPWARWG